MLGLGGGERPVQVSQQIVNVLNANRQAHRVFRYAGLDQFFRRKLAVGGRSRVRSQRFGIANIHQACEYLQRIEEGGTGFAGFALGGFHAKRQQA